MRKLGAAILGVVMIVSTGCALTIARRSPWDVQQLKELSDQLNQFKTLAKMKSDEADSLRQAKEKLQGTLGSSEASIGYDERGLVTRMLDKVLFDSGKAKLRKSAYNVLDKVGSVIAGLPDQPVGIEGHTDNEPIKVSGWADNNALSLARANTVAQYLIDKYHINSDRLTVIGYGEERPIGDNATPEGRQQNRRVEIVILPQASGELYRSEADRVLQSNTRYKK